MTAFSVLPSDKRISNDAGSGAFGAAFFDSSAAAMDSTARMGTAIRIRRIAISPNDTGALRHYRRVADGRKQNVIVLQFGRARLLPSLSARLGRSRALPNCITTQIVITSS